MNKFRRKHSYFGGFIEEKFFTTEKEAIDWFIDQYYHSIFTIR